MRTLPFILAALAVVFWACSNGPTTTVQPTNHATAAPVTKAPQGPTNLEEVPFDAPYETKLSLNETLEPLDDTEIYAVVFGGAVMNKLTDCINKYPDQASNFTVDFWTRAVNGSLSRLQVKADSAGPDIERCIFDVYKAHVSFREFGGSDKQASIPYKF